MPSALLLIPRNGSINETAGQTNPARSPVSKKRSVTSSAKRREEQEDWEGERERRAEFRSLVAGEVSAKQLGEKGTESDVSSARALE